MQGQNKQRLEHLELSCGQLFGQLDATIANLNSMVGNLQARLGKVQQLVTKITSDRQKATRFTSASCYPFDTSMELRFVPINFKMSPRSSFNDKRGHLGYKTGGSTRRHSLEAIEEGELESRKCLARLEELLKSINNDRINLISPPNGSFDGLKSASSLLVYHTFESRLIEAGKKGTRRGSLSSESSSLLDHTSRSLGKSNRVSLLLERTAHNKSSSEEADSNYLGPVPGSILKYHHQNSLIEADVTQLDHALDIMMLDDEDYSNQLTCDLPDVLPSLTGIVRDINYSSATARDTRQQKAISTEPTIESMSDETTSRSLVQQLEPLDQLASPLASSKSSTAPPPPPPPMPSAPLHAVAPINGITLQQEHPAQQLPQAGQLKAPAMPPPPPPPPPMPPMPPQVVATTAETPTAGSLAPPIIETASLSGRDALLAEIRSAASKPRSRKSRPEARGKENENDDMKEEDKKAQTKSSSSSGANPRDSLLASIREAAGKPKERSKAMPRSRKRIEEGKNGKDGLNGGSSSVGEVSLMSDLVNKLRARRDGISGSLVGTNQTIENTISNREPLVADTLQHRLMSKVSSMIPDISAKPQESSDSDRDGDSIDENDWS